MDSLSLTYCFVQLMSTEDMSSKNIARSMARVLETIKRSGSPAVTDGGILALQKALLQAMLNTGRDTQR